MHVMGIVGWKNSGKTTLVVDLVRLLSARGLKVGTIKHAHHSFDIDHPGKDSYLHREAGATDVIVASGTRWAQIHELRDDPAPELGDLLQRISPEVDIVLVEGFKNALHVKIEVVPPGFDGELLALEDPNVVAIASDAETLPQTEAPVLPRSEPSKVADFIMEHLGLAEGISPAAREV